MYKRMSNKELEITDISKLKMVHFYNIGIGGGEVTGMAVYCDNNTQINLCSLDREYKFLVDTVCRLYRENNDKDKIFMDEDTRKILNTIVNGSALPKVSYYGNTIPEIPERSIISEFFTPIIKYVFDLVAEIKNIKVYWKDEIREWFGKGYIRAIIDGADRKINFSIEKIEGGKYEMTIGTMQKYIGDISVLTVFDAEEVYISFCDERSLIGGMIDTQFDIFEHRHNTTVRISENGNVIYNKSYDICDISSDETDSVIEDWKKRNVSDFLFKETSDVFMCRLPWGQLYAYKTAIVPSGEFDKIIFTSSVFYEKSKYDNFLRFSFEQVRKNNERALIKTGTGCMKICGLYTPGRKIEINYEDVGCWSSGEYKEYLQNRYFVYEEKEEGLWQEKY